MPITVRVPLYVNPDTAEPEEVVQTQPAVYEFTVVNNDQVIRDITADTITVNSKDSAGDALAWTVTKIDATNGRFSISVSGGATGTAALGLASIDVLINTVPRLWMEANIAESEAS